MAHQLETSAEGKGDALASAVAAKVVAALKVMPDRALLLDLAKVYHAESDRQSGSENYGYERDAECLRAVLAAMGYR